MFLTKGYHLNKKLSTIKRLIKRDLEFLILFTKLSTKIIILSTPKVFMKTIDINLQKCKTWKFKLFIHYPILRYLKLKTKPWMTTIVFRWEERIIQLILTLLLNHSNKLSKIYRSKLKISKMFNLKLMKNN